ncbi:hypothetical protein [Amaricoccus sp.]|uniref:hypothetical protein n=1 Tax=Amaricoccus sp. TaxID=1872485 RepID=UPI001B792D8C|nr:hypothetical protein [Amaricoccus sp.]MBP7002060.1 hypothetical protein [Amaricoccus sp.]
MSAVPDADAPRRETPVPTLLALAAREIREGFRNRRDSATILAVTEPPLDDLHARFLRREAAR